MKANIRQYILIVFCLFTSLLHAQRGKFYSTTDAELSSSLINQLFQDNDGYIWIATEYGLNRFDGNHFTTYKHDDSVPTSIKNNYVSSLFQSSKGILLAGCVDGLMSYSKAADSFTEISMIKNGKSIFPNILDFCELQNRDILIATAGYGVFRLKNGEEVAHYDVGLNKKLPDKYISVLYLDSSHTLWMGTENQGAISYSFSTNKYTYYSYPLITGNNITSIIEDESRNIILGTLNNGINIIDKRTNSLIPVNAANNNLQVKQVIKIGKDVIICTDGQGIKRYSNNDIGDYVVNGAPYDFTNAKVHCILSDRDKNLWVGIFQKGVVLVPNQNSIFSYWGHRSLTFNPIGNGCVMSIFCDSNNDVWVGCDSQGVFQVDKSGNRKMHFSHNSPTDVPNIPLCMFEDSQHNFWIGSYASGVALMDRKSGKCDYLTKLKGQKVYCITEDKSKNIYVATLGSGFYVYNLDTKTIKQYKYYNDKNKRSQNGVIDDWINYILYDEEGYLWIAHYNGVGCFDLRKKRFIDTPLTKTITHCIAYSILKSDNGDMYIGTSNGLYLLKKKSGEIAHLTLNDGLPNEIVCGLEQDKQHNIWMSTYMGISKYIPAQNKFINYYAGDGIQGNEFTHGACFADKNGTIYFGGINGVTFFSDTKTQSDENRFNIYITALSVFGKRVNTETKSGNSYIVNCPVSQADKFTLSYSDNTFTFDLSTLNYVNPERVVYQYRIAELDKKWLSTAPGVNKITFNALPAGKYTFEVRAEVQGTYSNIRSAQIIITPPWYESWWAYALYLIMAAFVIRLLIIQYRSKQNHRREIMKREHAEQINEAKLQFFINISHEIRTPMTLIISPMEKLLREVNDPKLKRTYLMIYRNSQRILRLINQLMDIRKIDKGQFFLKFRETDIVGFIEDVKLTFDYLATKKKISFKFTHTMESLKVWVDLNNFDKIMMNLLSNAFKFTPENGSIEIELSTGSDEQCKGAMKRYFQISITDSGIGLDNEKMDKIFERFYQIDNDVTQSNFGTGIGLHLCRSLVELHHGTITAQNREDTNGSRFIIRLPMGCNHLKDNEIEMTDQDTLIVSPHVNNDITEYDSAPDKEMDAEKRGRTKIMKSVLVIEDDDEIKNYINDELKSEFHVITASDGKDGYEKVLTEMPDLIISDVMMPEMDGLTLCKKIKQNNNINQIPVMLLTAKSKMEDQIEGMESGADAYIVKPFNIDLLKSKVLNLIESRKLLKNKYVVLQSQFDKVEKIEMKSSDEQLMGRIMKVINQHIDDPELNVEMLAGEVGISRVHIHRKLKELTNMSARDFIKTIRLKQAAQMITEKRLSVAEVAYAVGYTNPSYFSNSFKEFYGVGPREYMSRPKDIE